MKFTSFLKDKWIFLLSQTFIIFFIAMLLSVVKISYYAIFLICLVIFVITFSALILEFWQKKKYYNELYQTLELMDKKQYISQIIEEPEFADGKVLYDVLKVTTKAMNDEIASYKILQEEYREYIETWIHEIKLPISCVGLICENNKNEITNSISDEIARIESFVEQALYYARSTNVEKDYAIQTVNLESFIKSIVKKHSKQLIACKTFIEFKDLNYTIYSDTKWLDFIIGQFIGNSIKYRKEPFKLSFSATENNTHIVLSIIDNGIGISEKDIGRVFEKGFTGENGRKFAKSTGIGLYLCKRLCDKMHLGLEIKSEIDVGTTVIIVFPKDKSILFGA